MTAALDPSSLTLLQDKLRHEQREAALVAQSLQAVRSGREPPMVAPVQTLESMAKDLLGEQMRLYVEIGDLELATREPLPSAPSPPAPTTVDGRAPKKAKMVQSTLVGFVLSSQRRRSHYPHAAPRTESY